MPAMVVSTPAITNTTNKTTGDSSRSHTTHPEAKPSIDFRSPPCIVPTPPSVPPPTLPIQPCPPPPPPPPPSISGLAPRCEADTLGGQSPGRSTAASRLPQQQTPTPRAQMKKLQWSKIPDSRVVNSVNMWTVSGKMFGEHRLNFDELESLFAIGSSRGGGAAECRGGEDGGGEAKEARGAEGSGGEKRKKSNEINLIDSKRSMNVSIFLRQFRATHSQIIGWLRSGSSELLGGERLRALLQILPEPEDLQRLAAFDGDREQLGQAERFYLELMTLPHNKLMVEALLTKEEFHQMTDYINPAIDAIILSAKDIKESAALHEIIYMVQMAGNFLNSGGYAGNAAGFKLSSMLKLTEIRANKPSVNLMHYLAQEAESKNPGIIDELQQLKYLSEASQYSQESLTSDVKAFRNRLITTWEQIVKTDHQFQQQLRPFLEAASAEMEQIEGDLAQLEQLRVELAQYLCEDEKSFHLDDCIGVFNTFCQRFVKAIQENREKRAQEAKAEHRRRQREQNSSKLSVQSVPCSNLKLSRGSDDVTSSHSSSLAENNTDILNSVSNQSEPAPQQVHEKMSNRSRLLHRRMSQPSIQSSSDTNQDSVDNGEADMLKFLLKSTTDESEHRRTGSLRLKRRPSRAGLFDRELTASPPTVVLPPSADHQTEPGVRSELPVGLRRGGPTRSSLPSRLLPAVKFVPSLVEDSLRQNFLDLTGEDASRPGSAPNTAQSLPNTAQSSLNAAQTSAEASKKKEHESRRLERRRRSNAETISKRKLPANPFLTLGDDAHGLKTDDDVLLQTNSSQVCGQANVKHSKTTHHDCALNAFDHYDVKDGIDCSARQIRCGSLAKSSSADVDHEHVLSPEVGRGKTEDSATTLTERALLEHRAGKWRSVEHGHDGSELLPEGTHKSDYDERELSQNTDLDQIYPRQSDARRLVRSSTLPHRMKYNHIEADKTPRQTTIISVRRNSNNASDIDGDLNMGMHLNLNHAAERSTVMKDKLKQLSLLYSDDESALLSTNANMCAKDSNTSSFKTFPRYTALGVQRDTADQRSDTDSLYSARDEGFESESLSNASASQRNSLNSALDVDIRVTPLMTRKINTEALEAGLIGPTGAEFGPIGAEPELMEGEPDCSTLSLFTRSIDSLVAKNDLSICEASIDIDEQEPSDKPKEYSAARVVQLSSFLPKRQVTSTMAESAVKMRRVPARSLTSTPVGSPIKTAQQAVVPSRESSKLPGKAITLSKPGSGPTKPTSSSLVKSEASAKKQSLLSPKMINTKTNTQKTVEADLPKTEISAKPNAMRTSRSIPSSYGAVSGVASPLQSGFIRGSIARSTMPSEVTKDKRRTVAELKGESNLSVPPKRSSSICPKASPIVPPSMSQSTDKNKALWMTSRVSASSGQTPSSSNSRRASTAVDQVPRCSTSEARSSPRPEKPAPSINSLTSNSPQILTAIQNMDNSSSVVSIRRTSFVNGREDYSVGFAVARPSSALSERVRSAGLQRGMYLTSKEVSPHVGIPRSTLALSGKVPRLVNSQRAAASTPSGGVARILPAIPPSALLSDNPSNNAAIKTPVLVRPRTLSDFVRFEGPEVETAVFSPIRVSKEISKVAKLHANNFGQAARGKTDKSPIVQNKLVRVCPYVRNEAGDQGHLNTLSSENVLKRCAC